MPVLLSMPKKKNDKKKIVPFFILPVLSMKGHLKENFLMISMRITNTCNFIHNVISLNCHRNASTLLFTHLSCPIGT